MFVGFLIDRVARWRELFDAAGVHAYLPVGYHVKATDRFLEVVSCRGGRIAPGCAALSRQIGQDAAIPVRLTGRARKVVDKFTGLAVAMNTDAFTLNADLPHAWLLEIIR